MQLELDLETRDMKLARRAFSIGYKRASGAYYDDKKFRQELARFMEQLEAQPEEMSV